MARKIFSTEVEFDGEKRTVHYIKPAAEVMLGLADKFKEGKLVNVTHTRELMSKCVVHEDGKPLDPAELDLFMKDDWDGVKAIQEILVPPPPKTEDGEAKNA